MKPTRRWFQYSLCSFLILLTVLAVWLGVIVNRAREQREAVKAIKAIKAVGGMTMPEAPSGLAWLAWIVGDDYFQRATVVSIWTPEPATHSDVMRLVPHLQRLRSLRQVFILWPVQEKTLSIED